MIIIILMTVCYLSFSNWATQAHIDSKWCKLERLTGDHTGVFLIHKPRDKPLPWKPQNIAHPCFHSPQLLLDFFLILQLKKNCSFLFLNAFCLVGMAGASWYFPLQKETFTPGSQRHKCHRDLTWENSFLL